MAKQLIVIRHAKSDWANALLRDFDRPLNKRGMRAAPEMAARLVNRGIQPDLLVSSPAKRAITTARYFAEAWEIPLQNIQEQPNIYEASAKTLLSIVSQFDNQYHQIALFGHNPGLTDLVNMLDGHIDNLPTCGIIKIDFDFNDWQMISSGTGKVALFDYPKNGDD